jgi:hypothetical protein
MQVSASCLVGLAADETVVVDNPTDRLAVEPGSRRADKLAPNVDFFQEEPRYKLRVTQVPVARYLSVTLANAAPEGDIGMGPVTSALIARTGTSGHCL